MFALHASLSAVVELHLDVVACRVDTGAFSFNSRCYRGRDEQQSGRAHGPVITVAAGDTLNLTLRNLLGAESPALGTTNAYHQPNHTNLHVHGLHVSPVAPADDVYATAAPGETLHYSYSIPATHPSGTFFYHPQCLHHTMVEVFLGLPHCHYHGGA